jgi:hypothetical protein
MFPGKPDTVSTEKEKTEGRGKYEYVFSCPSSLSLSFAVWPVDDYTKKEPLGEVRVTLKGENIQSIKAVKNLSGYYIFPDLTEGEYTLSVESNPYFSEERVVDTRSLANSKEPVVQIVLKPRPLYPFPERATLIRGMLASDPVLPADITVKAISKSVDLKTQGVIQGIPDERGEFVLYFREAKGKADVLLEIRGEGIEKIVPASVEEGRNTYTGIISIS